MASHDDGKTFVDLDDLDDLDGIQASVGASGDRFRIDDEIARGGLGRVHRAHDRTLDRAVAVKALLKPTPSARARFARETLLTARLQHPNIVPVYDGGRDSEGMPYLAMRLVDGVSLADAIADRPSLEERLDLLPHVIDVCNAIAYAHSQRIAHRDLKPHNLLVGDFGEAVVIDWGIAKDLDAVEDPVPEDPASSETESGAGSRSTLTRVGAVVGTPAYMPPEQAAGQPVEERADVYALGAVLYHTLAGVRPYDEADDTLAAVLAGPPRPVDRVVPGIPPDLVAVVAKAMARHPDDRYADARELARDLNQFRKGRFVSAYRYTPLERLQRTVLEHPVASALAVVLVLVLSVGAAMLSWSYTVVEAQRAAAVEARDEVAALQAEERELLDRVIEDQARLLMLEQPDEALRLLASLSDRAEHGPEVRSIAAAAYAAHPATRLPLRGEVRWIGGVVRKEGVVVASTDALWRRTDAGVEIVPIDARVRSVAGAAHGVLVCTERDTRLVPWAGDPIELAPHGCSQAESIDAERLGAIVDDVWTEWGAGGEVLVAWPVTARGGRGVRTVHRAPGGQVFVSVPGSMHRYAADTHQVLEVAAYEASVSPSGQDLALVGDDPALQIHTWADGAVAPVEVGLAWAGTAAWFDDQVIVVGGAEPRLVVVDLADPTDLRDLPLHGLPVGLERLGTDEMVAWTDTGALYRLTRHAGHVEAERLDGLARNPDWVAVDDAGVLLGSEGVVELQTLVHQEGVVVARHPGRVWFIEETDAGLLVGGEGGVEIWGPGPARQITDTPVEVRIVCGGRVWMGSAAGLLDGNGDVVVATDGPVKSVSCSSDGAFVGFATRGMVGRAARDGEEVWTRPVDQVGTFEVVGEQLLVGDHLDGLRVFDADGRVIERRPVEAMEGITALGEDVYYLDRYGVRSIAGWRHDTTAPPYTLAAAGDTLLMGDVVGTVWSWADRSLPPVRLDGHRQYVAVFEGRPGADAVATGAWDDTAWLWDLRGSGAGRPLVRHRAAVLALAWSADGQRLYTGDHEGVVRRWTDPLALDPVRLRRQIRGLAARLDAGEVLPAPTELDELDDAR